MLETDEQSLINAAARLTPQWLAGFFDGEGCVTASYSDATVNHGPRTVLRVNLTQKDSTILGLVQLRFPGSYTQKRRVKFGTVYCIEWRNAAALPLLEFIKDHVILKKQQVDFAIEFAGLVTGVGGKLQSFERRRRLELAVAIRSANASHHYADTSENEVIQ